MTDTNNVQQCEQYEECSRLLDQGRSREALALAESITDPVYRAMILIDAGFEAGKSSKVQEGTEFFESLLALDKTEYRFAKHSILYNAANGRNSLYLLKKKKRVKVVPPNDDDLSLYSRVGTI